MNKIIPTFILIGLIFTLFGCQKSESPFDSYDSFLNDENPEITIVFEDDSEIVIQLFPDIAPKTVSNFINLSEQDFYDNLTFHRVVKNFVMQGGDPLGDGTGGADNDIDGEFSRNGVTNDIPHVRGVISMARGRDYDSASSQFFLVHQDSKYLDGDYAAFGGIVEGFDVLDNFCNVKTDSNDKPIEDIIIKDIIVDTKGKSY